MQLLFIKLMAGNEIIKAICWTLIHSFWQGLLLAVAGGIVILFTKKHNASLRYNLLSGLFLLFMITACFTFITQLNQTTRQAGAGSVAITQVETQTPFFSRDLQNTLRPFSGRFVQGFIYYFDKNAAFIVTLWFIVFIVRLVKILSGLSYIRYISHHKLSAPADHWKQRIQELKAILRISKPIVLMESGIVKVPLVVGWLKPVILVPIGLLTQLSPQQLEAILLHELAHIKRRDYFVNLVQSFAEIIFFFNPAVLWISALIREERENCCDDIAIAVTKSKTKFINALVSFQEYNSAAGYAMAFPGRKNQLLNRVHRIIYNTNKTLDQTERAYILSCCLIIGFLCAAIVPSNVSSTMSQGVQAGVNRVISIGSVQQQEAKNAAGAVTSTPVGRLAGRKFPQRVFNIETKPGLSTTASPQAGNLKASKKLLMQHTDTIPVDYKEGKQSSKGIFPDAGINISADIKTDVSYGFRIQYLSGYGTGISLLKEQKPLNDVLIKIAGLGVKLNYNPSTLSYKPDTSINIKPYKGSKPDPHSDALADPVIGDLIRENIISRSIIENRENFSYILNNEALIVQGIRQAEDVYLKMRAKYIKPTGKTTYSYSWINP